MLPFIVRAFDTGNPFDLDISGVIFTILENMFLMITLWLNYTFVLSGLVDF